VATAPRRLHEASDHRRDPKQEGNMPFALFALLNSAIIIFSTEAGSSTRFTAERMPVARISMKPSELFHRSVANWFVACFNVPTSAQAKAWPAIKAGQHTLVAGPTGSGKTLAAFLATIDDLIRQGPSGS